MASYNKVILIGNLTRDPETRFTPSGSAICEFGLAVNRRFQVNGEDREEVCFVDISVWGKQGEACGKYLRKGAPLFVEGHLKLDQWDDRETGGKRSKMRVIAERTQFLGAPSRGDSYGSDYGAPGAAGQQDNGQGPAYPPPPPPPPPPRQDAGYRQAPAAPGPYSQAYQPRPQAPAARPPQPRQGYQPPRPDETRQQAPQYQAPPPENAAPAGAFETEVEEVDDDIPF